MVTEVWATGQIMPSVFSERLYQREEERFIESSGPDRINWLVLLVMLFTKYKKNMTENREIIYNGANVRLSSETVISSVKWR